MGRANTFLKGNQLQIIEKVTATAGANKTSGLLAGFTVSATTMSNPASLGSGIEAFSGTSEGILGLFRTKLSGTSKAELGYLGVSGQYGLWATNGGFGGTANASSKVDIVATGLDVSEAGGLIITGTGTMTFGSNTLSATVATLESPVLNTAVSGSAFLDEDAMGSNSATKVASQQSIKAYVDAQTITTFGTLTDATITSIGANEMLQWSGSAWINQTIAELGLLKNISEDGSPQLGGNLDVQSTSFLAIGANSFIFTADTEGQGLRIDGSVNDITGNLTIIGGATARDVVINMTADAGADNGDAWQIKSTASDNVFRLGVWTGAAYSERFSLTAPVEEIIVIRVTKADAVPELLAMMNLLSVA